MGSISHHEIQELVKNLSDDKLLRAFRMLQELADEPDVDSCQRGFMKLSLEEHRRQLASQVEQVKDIYEQTGAERQPWQSGDFWNGD